MFPSTDRALREMQLTNKVEAVAFVKAYRAWLYDNSATGNGAFLPARSKPATVRAPDLVAKAAQAWELAEMNYWQMPYEAAKRAHHGLPFKKWQAARIARGLDIPAAQQ